MSLPKINANRSKQCVSEKSTPYKPLKTWAKRTCLFHPSRVNCRAIKRRALRAGVGASEDSGVTVDEYTYHETVMETVYMNQFQQPYYYCLVNNAKKRNSDAQRDQDADYNDRGLFVTDAVRGFVTNADDLYAFVHLRRLDDEERFYGIDESGERQMRVLTNVLKYILDAFSNCNNHVLLCADELQIDLMYSVYRVIILPQRVITIPLDEEAPLVDEFNAFSVPNTENCVTSQNIYRTFLMYNTMLTIVLKQRNPFNDPSKSISIVLRTLGKCPANKDRIKCCDLNYGGNAPGHVMCAPREMIKRIFHYAKWARSPNNYKRYYELITKQSSAETQKIIKSERNQNDARNVAFVVMDWYNFIFDFRVYFGVSE
ncbi:VP1054 protein [Gynaephora ruoergensis nucleopolyhedrovirus]|nr:VP1054 protein [Gynaephora ruoergensis nucleopolyhedrovirus]